MCVCVCVCVHAACRCAKVKLLHGHLFVKYHMQNITNPNQANRGQWARPILASLKSRRARISLRLRNLPQHNWTKVVYNLLRPEALIFSTLRETDRQLGSGLRQHLSQRCGTVWRNGRLAREDESFKMPDAVLWGTAPTLKPPFQRLEGQDSGVAHDEATLKVSMCFLFLGVGGGGLSYTV